MGLMPVSVSHYVEFIFGFCLWEAIMLQTEIKNLAAIPVVRKMLRDCSDRA